MVDKLVKKVPHLCNILLFWRYWLYCTLDILFTFFMWYLNNHQLAVVSHVSCIECMRHNCKRALRCFITTSFTVVYTLGLRTRTHSAIAQALQSCIHTCALHACTNCNTSLISLRRSTWCFGRRLHCCYCLFPPTMVLTRRSYLIASLHQQLL